MRRRTARRGSEAAPFPHPSACESSARFEYRLLESPGWLPGVGVTYALVEGVVEYAASQGLDIIEAYPVETEGERISSTLAYMGTTKLFGAVGFRVCAQTTAKSGGKARVVMRRTVDSVSTTGLE